MNKKKKKPVRKEDVLFSTTTLKSIKVTRKYKILVVEDDDVVAEKLRESLLYEYFDVICVFTEYEALKTVFTYSDIDLILMNVKIPILDDFELPETIHHHCPNSLIICISDDDIPEKYKSHFVAHHKKPFMIDTLLNSIKEQIKLAERVKLLLSS